MAKFELKFYDFFDSTTIQVVNMGSHIQILSNDEDGCVIIDLDKSTAIKFAKTLRTEINKITESDGENGKTN